MSTLITNGWVKINPSEEFSLFESMTEEDKRIWHFIDGNPLPTQLKVRVYQKNENVIMAKQLVSWAFHKNRFYTKRTFETVLTVTPKRVFNNASAGSLLCSLLGVSQHGHIPKTVMRDIIKRGPVAYREYVKNNASKFMAHELGMSWDYLNTFTTDADAIVSRMRSNFNMELKDLIQQAVVLNKIVKHTWSDRKIHDVHMKWTEEIQAIKCRNCSTNKIWNIDVKLPDNITLLNSERDVANEGAKMHHCVYTNYMYDINNKAYVVFHVSEEDGREDYTVGIETTRNGAMFHQCFKAYNQEVSPSQLEFAKSLVPVVDMMVTMDRLENN